MNFTKKQSTSLNIIKKRKIKILLKEPKNNECFECSNYYPEYISLNNGIFLCHNCITNHLKLPKSISNIIKNNLSSLNLKNIQYLCCGGNQKLIDFINSEYPNLNKISKEYFYQTYAMDYYRKWLEYLIEGGIKPKKPDPSIAYELINIPSNIKNIKNQQQKNTMKNMNEKRRESYMKINKIKYPKIKPIVGSKNSFRFTRSLSRHNNDNLNLTSIGNINNTYDNDNVYNYSNCKSTTSGFKKRFFSLQFNNKYDIEDIDNERNNITDINEITDYNDEEEDNILNKNDNLKIKNKIYNKFNTNIKVFRTNDLSPIDNNNLRNTIYSKPIYQNYLNSFHNGKSLYMNKNEYQTEKTEEKQELINSIDNLRNYLNRNRKANSKCIFDLKHNNSNDFNIGKKLNINNINNNIIINKSLNIYYNNNSLNKIFKKKTIGNSFSINDKKQKDNFINNPINKNVYFMNATMGNLFNSKKKYLNDWKQKLIEEENENSNYIEKIKVNRQFKNNNINNFNKIITESTYLKFDNEKESTINTNQKSKIIQRISRALKTQKEREEKKKSLEKIKVKQKEKNNYNKDNIINNDITPKGEYNNIKIDDKTPKIENNKININDKTPRSEDISKDQRKKNTISIKELINIPSSKKKNILELIKTNNLTNKLVSPNSKKLIQTNTGPKKLAKNEFNSKTSIREMYKRKKNQNKNEN